ncbi:hypothetical protein ACWAT4_08350 [Bradyrhizobium manausense]
MQDEPKDAGPGLLRDIAFPADAQDPELLLDAVPIESQRAELFLDLRGLKRPALGLDRRPDPAAAPLQEVAPAVADLGPALRQGRIADRVEDIGISVNQLGPPIVGIDHRSVS